MQIDASPDLVYGLITDLPTLATLAEEAVAMEWRKGNAVCQGAVFVGHNENGAKRWSTTCTVTDAEPGRVFAFDVRYTVLPIARWQYDIAAADGGCRVTESTWDRRPGWFRKFAAPSHRCPRSGGGQHGTHSAHPAAPQATGRNPIAAADMARRDPPVAVVGAGMSGLCVAIALLRTGITDVTIYEKADEVGGTWRDNTYPGLFWTYLHGSTSTRSPPTRTGRACSRPATKSRPISGALPTASGSENGSGSAPKSSARDSRTAAGCCAPRTATESAVDFLISATGVLHRPRLPTIPGLADFGGAVFHSARWDHDVALRGRRVAVVGTGSTGVQLVCGLADVAGKTMLFQRTAHWVMKLPNPHYTRFTSMTRRRIPWLSLLAYRLYSAGYRLLRGRD